MPPRGPYKLCTVNMHPERAKLIVGRIVKALREDFTIFHVENVSRIEDVQQMCERNKPDVLFCASVWTTDESDEIQEIAKQAVPGIKTVAIPQGLQAEKGPDGVIQYLKEKWPSLVTE